MTDDSARLDDKVLESITKEVADDEHLPGRRTIRRLLAHIKYLKSEIQYMDELAAGESI